MVKGPADAYAACARIARRHDENFPVASLLLPRPMRPHVAAVYAFARAADDFADEGDGTPEARLALLDRWHERLLACAVPRTSAAAGEDHGDGAAAAADAVFAALGATIRDCRLPVSPFEDLLSAFRQDVTTTRYETWDDLLDYCRRSANPVGRIVLRIAGIEDDAADRAADSLCTALQLTNFWQDLARDWRHGRLYVPLEDCRRAGADPADLDHGRLSPAWREVLGRLADRTAGLFEGGRAVCDRVGGRLGLELRFTWLGGRRILERTERAGFDVFGRRPALGAADVPALVWQAARWRAR
jgi:squalene synthase HpnC